MLGVLLSIRLRDPGLSGFPFDLTIQRQDFDYEIPDIPLAEFRDDFVEDGSWGG